ncbi:MULTISPECIES: hypothetical protein [Bacillus]|uniref:hypothetical protein n=1 Tax=Bacillus TaxID=1386 RepID=UPI0015C3463F|nr:hypothetical protein [Bacillus sonorensis]
MNVRTRVKVTDLTFENTKQIFSEQERAEFTLLNVARFLETLAVDLDEAPPSWDGIERA